MPLKKATHQQTKQRNRDIVLRMIFEHDPISRAEIGRSTKLTRATVSDMVANLIDHELVKEIGYGTSTGGKAPILLSLNADSRYLIGLNLAQTMFIGSVVNLRGEIKETVEFPVDGSDGKQALQLVYRILDRLVEKTWRPIVGIGIGTPGLVNTREGIVVDAVNLDWRNLPLAHLLESHYNLPVSVLNDSQATAIGEFVYGAPQQYDNNLVVINVRHGIGAGILINGRLFQGDGGGAGEIGHVVVLENGPQCRCGKHGCLETIASARAVVDRAVSMLSEFPHSGLAKNPQSITLEDIDTAFQEKDPLAQHVVYEAAHYLGASLANLIGVLNIHKIILTGDMVRFGDPWLTAVKTAMLESALTQIAEKTEVEIGKLEFRGCILGASAYMLLENYSLLFKQSAR